MTELEQKKSNEIGLGLYLPYLGSFIVFLGVIRLMCFYSAFGIQIVSYLEFSEIITSFLDIIVIAAFVFMTSLLQNFLMMNKSEQDEQNSIRQKIFIEGDFFKRLLLYVKYSQKLLLAGLILSAGSFFWQYLVKKQSYWIILWVTIFFLAVFLFVILTTEIDIQHAKFNSSNKSKRFISIIINTLLFIGFVIAFTQTQIKAIKNDKSTYGVSIIFDNDKLLISDSVNYYIGNTKNYLFIYHERNNTTDVIPMTRIKQLTITHNKND